MRRFVQNIFLIVSLCARQSSAILLRSVSCSTNISFLFILIPLNSLQGFFGWQPPDLEIVFDIDMIDTSDGLTAISIYRIVCEGCQNIIKHSKASHIQISVKETGNQIKILIKDDGIGMQEYDQCTSNHFGLHKFHQSGQTFTDHLMIVNYHDTNQFYSPSFSSIRKPATFKFLSKKLEARLKF